MRDIVSETIIITGGDSIDRIDVSKLGPLEMYDIMEAKIAEGMQVAIERVYQIFEERPARCIGWGESAEEEYTFARYKVVKTVTEIQDGAEILARRKETLQRWE